MIKSCAHESQCGANFWHEGIIYESKCCNHDLCGFYITSIKNGSYSTIPNLLLISFVHYMIFKLMK